MRTFVFAKRPLRLLAVPDGALSPDVHQGQLVFVEPFHPRGVGYIEQLFALRYRGRLMMRHIQIHIGAALSLFTTQEGFQQGQPGHIKLPYPDDWPNNWPAATDWCSTGQIHPDVTLIGPLIYDWKFSEDWIDIPTAGWSN